MIGLCLIKVIFDQNVNLILFKKKHQIDKKLFRQDPNFSIRLPFATKKIRELYYAMVDTK